MTTNKFLGSVVLKVCTDVLAEFEQARDTAADPHLRCFRAGMYVGALVLAGHIGALTVRADDAQESAC